MSIRDVFVRSFDEIVQKYDEPIERGETTFIFIASNDSEIFEKLFCQTMKRDIDGQPITFFAIRECFLYSDKRGNKLFTNFIEQLKTRVNVMIHDIINPRLNFHLIDGMGFTPFREIKNDENVLSAYVMRQE